MQQRNIPVTISSDAHQPAEVSGYFEYAARVLAEVGYQKIRVLIDGRWQETPLESVGDALNPTLRPEI